MVVILSQDRKAILNAEEIKNIHEHNGVIFARTKDSDNIALGTYNRPENITKVMTYIGYSLSMAKDAGGMIVIPSEDVVNNDKEIAKQFVEALKAKKAGEDITGIKLAPEIEEILKKKKGGEDK